MSARRTFNVGEVVLAAFKICGDHWKELLKVTAMTVLPASIFGLLLVSTFMPDVLMDALGNNSDSAAAQAALRAVPSSDWVNLGIAFFIYIAISSIATTLALGASIYIAIAHHEGRPLTPSEALRAAGSKLPSMIWLFFVSGLLLLIGFVLCVLPGVWLFISWAAAPVVLIREDLKGTKAMGRSFRLVKPFFWLVFAVVALEIITTFVLQAVAGVVPSLFLTGAVENNSFASFFALSLASAISSLFGIALHAAISSELYLALKAQEQTAMAQ